MTTGLRDALASVEIRVLDHLIIAGSDLTSMPNGEFSTYGDSAPFCFAEREISWATKRRLPVKSEDSLPQLSALMKIV